MSGNFTRRQALFIVGGGILTAATGAIFSSLGGMALAADDKTIDLTFYKGPGVNQNLPSLIETRKGEFGFCLHPEMYGEQHDSHAYGQSHTVWNTYDLKSTPLTGRHAWYACHCGYGCDLGLDDPVKSQHLAQYLIYNSGMYNVSKGKPVEVDRPVPGDVINDYVVNLTGIPMSVFKDRRDKCEAWYDRVGNSQSAIENRTFFIALGPGSNASSWQPVAVRKPKETGFIQIKKELNI